MESFVLPVFVATFIKKLTDLVAFITAKDWKAVIKQVIAYVGGVVAVGLAKAADFGSDYVLPGLDKTVSDLNGYGTLLLGLLLASGASVVADVIASRDDNSSAYVPPIGGPPDTTPPPG